MEDGKTCHSGKLLTVVNSSSGFHGLRSLKEFEVKTCENSLCETMVNLREAIHEGLERTRERAAENEPYRFAFGYTHSFPLNISFLKR